MIWNMNQWLMEEINSLGDNIDYVLITAGDLELRPEEEALVNSWFDTQEDREEADTNMQMVELEKEQDDIENDAADSEDDTSCAELIHSLNGGCDYHLLFGICIQDSPVYVLELINDWVAGSKVEYVECVTRKRQKLEKVNGDSCYE